MPTMTFPRSDWSSSGEFGWSSTPGEPGGSGEYHGRNDDRRPCGLIGGDQDHLGHHDDRGDGNRGGVAEQRPVEWAYRATPAVYRFLQAALNGSSPIACK